MFHRSLRFECLAPVATALAVVAAFCASCIAQPPTFDAQGFEKFFQDTPEEQRQLEQVEITPAEEERLGDRLVEQFLDSLARQKIDVIDHGRDAEYVAALVEEIRPHMAHADRYPTIHVYVADAEATDARSFPGGTIVVSRGLIEFAESEAALVGVIAHELSHIDRGHQLGELRRLKLSQETFAGGPRSPADFMTGGMMLAKHFAHPFRPEDELEADLDGARWAFEAGYDPMEMADLFRRFQKRDGERDEATLSFLRTHPYHKDRYAAVRRTTRELQRAAPAAKLYIGRENLKQRVPRAQKQFAD